MLSSTVPTFIVLFFLIQNAATLVCHRKDCHDVPNCQQNWDICAGDFCYILRLRNVTNSQQFLLRRGCFAENSLQIRFNAELEPYHSLNECHRILWKDIEYLVKICADRDYCNICESWTERAPAKSAGIPTGEHGGLSRMALHWWILCLFIFCTVYPFNSNKF